MELKSCYLLGGEKVDGTRRLLGEPQPGPRGAGGRPAPLPVSLPLLTSSHRVLSGLLFLFLSSLLTPAPSKPCCILGWL